jgi:large subunit ribosomal protein L24
MPLYKRAKRTTVKSMPIKKDDMVVVLTGKDAGKQGKVIESNPRRGVVVVDGVNVVTKHRKPSGQSARIAKIQSGRIQSPGPMHVSKVMLICPKCNKTTRVAMRRTSTGRAVRACRKCKEIVDLVD